MRLGRGHNRVGIVIASVRRGATSSRRKEDAVLRLPGAAFSRIASILVLIIVLLVVAVGRAAPPDGADPNSAVGQWFQSLKQPGTGASCCSIADCRPVEYRLSPDGYEAFLDAKWVRIPDHTILHGKTNPIDRAVLCRAPISGLILCFVPASET
jgi:hypothetical protein